MDDRYSRQILFSPVGTKGQEKLLSSRVLIAGCGALGSSHSEMLARAGVGKLRIVDRDFVEFSNLQRQTLFSESDAENRLPKAVAAKNRIAEVNPSINVEASVADINASNIESFVKDCDVVIDGSDNFQLRYLVNDACVKHSIPWVYGAAVSSYGSTMTIIPNETPCLRCVFEEMPDAGSSPTCDTAGVIMPIISTISAIQVSEAIKLLVDDKGSRHQTLMQIDVWTNERHAIKLGEPNPDCPACAQNTFEFLDVANGASSAVLCGRDAVQISPSRPTEIDLALLAARIQSAGEVKHNEYLVRFFSGENEVTVFRDGRAIIKGTDDISVGRSIYARFVGA
ncbi:MAG: ThiF family adenylyltransferase [Blastocatellia bacterium]|nr:ThiF family adenylyltransferase [Blastocatellia bacterium]